MEAIFELSTQAKQKTHSIKYISSFFLNMFMYHILICFHFVFFSILETLDSVAINIDAFYQLKNRKNPHQLEKTKTLNMNHSNNNSIEYGNEKTFNMLGLRTTSSIRSS